MHLKETILLIDFSNIAWATYHTNTKICKDSTFTPDQVKQHWKYLMLNSIMKLRLKHGPTETVVCFDSRSWRKKIFRFYKARRSAVHKADANRDHFLKVIDEMHDEIKEYFPYKVCRAPWAEADDIVGVLVNELADTGTNIIIASRDKDFKQLLASNVKLWDTQTWKWIKCPDPKIYLIKHLLMGDAGDDVPNVRSDDDTFITDGKRQKACGPKAVEKILVDGLQDWVKREGLVQNWKRNVKMIRLSKYSIPKQVWAGVWENYVEQEEKKGNYMLLAKYLGEQKLRALQKNIDKLM